MAPNRKEKRLASTPRSRSLQRFESFSDGVYAIILTIMAIELKIPNLVIHPTSVLDFRFLVAELPKLTSYALGFFMVSTGWVSHLLMSRELQRTNMQLIATNLVGLFLFSLIPAATAFVGDRPALSQAVILWTIVSTTALAWFVPMVWASKRAGVAVPDWAVRRNRFSCLIGILAVGTSFNSIRAPWVLIFFAYGVQWIPIPIAIRIFAARPASIETLGADVETGDVGV